jgi:glutamate transport system substrate-binding protein
MRRLTLATALVSLLALVGAACGDDDDDTATDDTTTTTAAAGSETESESEPAAEEFPAGSTMAELKEAGTMTVGTKFDQPLFGLNNAVTGEVEGFDVEIAKLIAERIDPELEIEFIESVSQNREPFLQGEDPRVDMVVATYTINDARKEVVDFAGPYYVAGQDIMVKAGDTSIAGVEDLNGKKVCSAQGSTSIENVAELAPQADLSISFQTYSQCAEALADGRVAAVTTDNVILLGLIDASEGEFELVENPFTEEPYGIGLPKGDEEFRTFVNDVLEEIYASGEWAEAFEATAGTAGVETPEPPEVDRY